MELLFTVCGRAGSKGIRNKNVRDFLGHPLPYYTLGAIDLFRRISEHAVDVVVNTDSRELMDLAERNPFFPLDVIERRAELAGDLVAKGAVLVDCLRRMTERKGKTYDMVVDLDITSPLRTVRDIDALVRTHVGRHPDVTFSVVPARRNPYFNMVMAADRGVRKVLASDFVARQQAPAVYDMNASLYAYSPEFLLGGKGVLDGYAEIIEMADTGVLDLDHENDFELMEVVARHVFDKWDGYRDVYMHVCRSENKCGFTFKEAARR